MFFLHRVLCCVLSSLRCIQWWNGRLTNWRGVERLHYTQTISPRNLLFSPVNVLFVQKKHGFIRNKKKPSFISLIFYFLFFVTIAVWAGWAGGGNSVGQWPHFDSDHHPPLIPASHHDATLNCVCVCTYMKWATFLFYYYYYYYFGLCVVYRRWLRRRAVLRVFEMEK